MHLCYIKGSLRVYITCTKCSDNDLNYNYTIIIIISNSINLVSICFHRKSEIKGFEI